MATFYQLSFSTGDTMPIWHDAAAVTLIFVAQRLADLDEYLRREL